MSCYRIFKISNTLDDMSNNGFLRSPPFLVGIILHNL
jgi:hypothetical protein